MTTLYPRLPIHEGRRQLREWSGRRPEELKASAMLSHEAATFAPTGGVPVSSEHLGGLTTSVRDLAGRFGYPAATSERHGTQFDRASAQVLHETMNLSAAEAAEPDIWTFLACCLLPDVVMWRWGTRNEERWLGQGLVRHAFGRLWWQAHVLRVGHDYALLWGLSEADLNQVFERRTIGGNPPLARALVRELASLNSDRSLLPRRDVLRDVTKRVRRLLPYTAFAGVAEEDIGRRISALVRESVRELFNARAEHARL